MFFSRPAGIKWIDRGNITANDFTNLDLTTDYEWHDLDLSGIIPKGATRVNIRLYAMELSGERVLMFKTKDNVNDFNCSTFYTQGLALAFSCDFNISPNVNGVIQYKIENATSWNIVIVIKGWFV